LYKVSTLRLFPVSLAILLCTYFVQDVVDPTVVVSFPLDDEPDVRYNLNTFFFIISL